MPQFSAESIQRLEEVLRKDPNSQAFAPLAEAYRKDLRLSEAEKVAAHGVKRHPQFAGGWVGYGKILKDLKRTQEALEAFTKATQLAPENLLALQMAGECSLELKRPKDALKFFKRVLFFSPQAEKAKRIVAKLESLTADEYGEEVFAMTKLSDLRAPLGAGPAAPGLGTPTSPKPLDSLSTTAPVGSSSKASPVPAAAADATMKGLMRFLSLVDAFIVRNDITRASQLLDESAQEYGAHPEIDQRRRLLQRRRSAQLGLETEVAEPLSPLQSREERVRDRKIAVLQGVLRRIEQHQEPLR